jgi:formylglycine-generating enzyme required for sulfatase activity
MAVMVLAIMGETAHSQGAKEKRRALLVGVNEYNHERIAKLQYSENDVTKLAAELKECGFEVTLLTATLGAKDETKMPTAANIRKAFAKMLDGLGSKDLVLVGLSGQGMCFEVEDGSKKRDESFFCPQDARPKMGSTLAENSKTMLGYTEILKDLSDSGCGAKMLLVDACRDRPAGGFRSSDMTTKPALPRGTAAFFSCKVGEKSIEHERYGGGHGLFFHHVIEGLKGEAQDKMGQVTWLGLAAYVMVQVQLSARAVGEGFQQTPELRSEMSGAVILRSGLKTGEAATKTEKVGKQEYLTIKLGKPEVPMKFVKIPAGEFMMGADKAADDEANEDEKPRHKVKISKAFWLGVTEVTQEQYEAICGENPSWFSATGQGKDLVKRTDTRDFPVESVSWEDAKKFCAKLSEQVSEKKAGRKYRLPSEAQWEYACRGRVGYEENYKRYPFGDKINKGDANFSGTELGRPCKVGSYRANAMGVYDMVGNVWEWCEDGARTYAAIEERDPLGPLAEGQRVNRGGSWGSVGRRCRSAYRGGNESTQQLNYSGFRVVLSSAEGRDGGS